MQHQTQVTNMKLCTGQKVVSTQEQELVLEVELQQHKRIVYGLF